MAQDSKTKVVIRKLPPYLKQDGFLEAVNKGFEDCYDWFSYFPGKLSHRRLLHSRAYLNFKHPEQVYDFYESFNGHTFVNEKGVQFRAEVEYAPYQKIPKGRNKKDLREGTIFEDPDYLAFLEELEHPKRTTPITDAQKEETEKAASKGPIITPLIQYIRDKRASKAAAGREKVGPRTSSRDVARKGALGTGSGVALGRNAKGSASEKGTADRKGSINKDDASRKASSKSDGRSRRESASASESGRSEAPSQRPPLSSPRDAPGIPKRPPTSASDLPSPAGDRRKDAPSRNGPEKRIVKGALASIIGGGLGRPPRGNGNPDVRKETDEEGQETRGGGSRGSGRQARKLQRNAPEQRPLSTEPTGWGDTADGLSGKSDGAGGATGDWGSENPLAADEAKAKGVAATTKKEGSSRRAAVRNRSAGRKDGEASPTGWDDVSEGLLGQPGAGGSAGVKASSPRGNSGAQARVPSAASGKQSHGGTAAGPQVKIMQRPAGDTVVEASGGRSDEPISSRMDSLTIGDSAAGSNPLSAPTPRSSGRGQDASSSQAGTEAVSEGVGRGGGRNARRRAQGRGQHQEREIDTAAAAAAAWAALSGAAPGAHPPLESATPQVRIMQRAGPSGAPVSPVPTHQSTAPAGSPGASDTPRLQPQSGAPGRGQGRPGRQPRHQGPYQPMGRGAARGARNGSQSRQGEGSDGANSAAPGGPVNRGPGENGSESGRKGGGKETGAAPTGGASAEAAAAKKQMWMAVQKPG